MPLVDLRKVDAVRPLDDTARTNAASQITVWRSRKLLPSGKEECLQYQFELCAAIDSPAAEAALVPSPIVVSCPPCSHS